MTFVSLATAKTYLRVTDPAKDAEVSLAIAHASAVISDYLKRPTDAPVWDETTTPDLEQRATLKMLGHLWEDRDGEGPADGAEKTWLEIRELLRRRRDPALA